MTRREFPWLGTKPGPAPEMRISPYGRSPMEKVLADCREITLVHERMLHHGPILPGQTLYRYARGLWRVLPDPEKAK